MNRYEVPREKPKYHFVEAKKEKKHGIYSLLDKGVTVYGFLLVFAYAILLLISSFNLKLTSIVIFIIFWFMLTYIAFPRIHSFFTSMYLPDYFLARTKTGDGILGDPVNFGLLGSEEDIHASMRKAGWTRADPINFRSSLGIVLSTIKHTSYPEAPVSSLYLFNKKQDFAYQMEVDGSATRRHHVRFWKVPEGWTLPGGKKVDWLAAGTFYKGIGITSATFQITHKIDKQVDKERDFIIESLLYIDNDIKVDIIEQFTIPYRDENGGGDSIETDGNMPIVDVNGATDRICDDAQQTEEKGSLQITKKNETLNRELPPKSLLYLGAFVITKLVVASFAFAAGLFVVSENYSADDIVSLVIIFGALIGGLINLLLYILTLKKYKWSRLIFLIISSISCTFEFATLFTISDIGFLKLLSGGFAVAIVLVLSSLDVRQWVYTVKKRGE